MCVAPLGVPRMEDFLVSLFLSALSPGPQEITVAVETGEPLGCTGTVTSLSVALDFNLRVGFTPDSGWWEFNWPNLCVCLWGVTCYFVSKA